MGFKHLPIDENESPDISIINTISEKQFEFFGDLIPKFINDFINDDVDDVVYFEKYLNIYIFENLWDISEKEIYTNIIKFIYQDKENIDKFILYFDRVITETKKSSFWHKLICEFITNELCIGSVNINLILLIDLVKRNLIEEAVFLNETFEETFLYPIISAPIDTISLQSKQNIMLIFLKNKLTRKLVISWMYRLINYTEIIKSDIIGHTEDETLDEYEERIVKVNNATHIGSICLKLFYNLWKDGMPNELSINKIDYNFITSKSCPLNFCEQDENNTNTEYNFITHTFFIIYKLFDTVYISSYHEVIERKEIIKELESAILNNQITLGLYMASNFNLGINEINKIIDRLNMSIELEQKRINCIEFKVTKDIFNISEFISTTCRWIKKNKSKIKIGSLDAIINTIHSYFINNEEVLYTTELFELFSIIIYLDNEDNKDNKWKDTNITNNILLKIKCIEIIYSFMDRPTFTEDWHLLLFFENNLDEIISKLINLYINSENDLNIYDSYSKCFIKYKFIYILTTLTDFSQISMHFINLSKKKQFCKLLLDDISLNIENLILYLDSIKKLEIMPNMDASNKTFKTILLKTKNINVFIISYFNVIINLKEIYNKLFISDEIINAFTNLCSYTLKTLTSYKDLKFTNTSLDIKEYLNMKDISSRFETILQRYYLEDNFNKNILENTDSKIIKYLEVFEEILIDNNLYKISVEYKMKAFIDILKEKDETNKSMDDLEPPDEFCDPIMQTLIEKAVILPNTDTIMDKGVISRHLLTDKYNPFNRDALTLESLEEFNNTPEIKEKISAFNTKLNKWKKENKVK